MRRLSAATVALLVVASALAAVPAATMAQETTTETAPANDQADENATMAPGAQLSGIVGVSEAELEGEVESRSFGIRVAKAATDDAKADVVADQLNRSGERVAALEQRRDELAQARENGSISESEYRARAATLHAESKSTARLVNETSETASQLPAEALEAKGINATAIQTLADQASELSGPEVAEIARSIAGADVGKSARADAAGDRGAQAAGDRDGDRPEAAGDAVDSESTTETTATDGSDADAPVDGDGADSSAGSAGDGDRGQ